MRGLDKGRLERCDELAYRRGYAGPRGKQFLKGEKRVRSMRNLQWERPASETFDEFIVNHVKYVLGKEWGNTQLELPLSDQHIVICWLLRLAEHQRTIFPKEHQLGRLVVAKPTGDAMELLSLSEDLYRLNLVDRLFTSLLDRLRDRGEFQGARYEIATAAAFIRAGFAVDWVAPSRLKSPEFTATIGKDVLVVEAQSRHGQGFIHQPGKGGPESTLQADVEGLYNRALEKDTGGKPLVVCIDVNLPLLRSGQQEMPHWSEDVRQFFDRRAPSEAKPCKEFSLLLTNFNWHFAEDQLAPGQTHICTFPEWTIAAPDNDETFAALLQAFDGYGNRPAGVY